MVSVWESDVGSLSQETVSECVSSYSEGSATGSESGHQGALRSGADEESLSGESQDGLTPGKEMCMPFFKTL